MKKLLTALIVTGLLGLGLLLALSSLAAQLRGPSYDPVAEAAARQTIQRMDAIAPAQTAAAFVLALFPAALAIIALGLATAGGSVAIWRFFRERSANQAGLLPVDYRTLDEVSPRALAGFHAARLAEAQRALVPAQLHYSPSSSYAPRMDYRGEPERLALPAPDDAAAELPQLPGVIDLAQIPFQPSKDAILLGVAEGNELITVPMRALWHIGTAGPTGAGKSNIARLILPQLQALGAKVAIIDPKWTPFDAESGEDWRGIGSRLFLPAARRAEDMRQVIAYFHEELERRLDQRNAGQKLGGPLFLYADEFTTITADVKNADEQIARIARLGRGVGIFLLIAAHDLLVKGGAGDTRDQLRTGFYLGGDSKTGSVLLDLPQRVVIEREAELTMGTALLRCATASPPRLVRVPYASNQAIAGLLGEAPAEAPSSKRPLGFRPAGATEGATEGAEREPLRDRSDAVNLNAEEARIVAAFKAGKSASELAAELAGGRKSGDAYAVAARKVAEILRKALG
jgi:hypothetical protein